MSNTLFTFIAQVVNFLVLVIALRFLLFKRIRSAMKKRQESIQEKWDQADEQRGEAEREAEGYRKQKEELEKEKDRILKETREKAEEESKKQRKEAREKIEKEEQQWKEELEEEKNSFFTRLEKTTGEGIINLTNKVIKDLSDAELQKKSIDRFIDRLQNLSEEEKGRVFSQSGPITVYTPQPIDSSTEETIKGALSKAASNIENREYLFSEDSSLGVGIEIDVQGKRLGWNSRLYLENFRKEMETAYEEQ